MSAPEHNVPKSNHPRLGANSPHDDGLPGSVRNRPEPNVPAAMTSGTTATMSAYGPTRSMPINKKAALATTRSNPSRAIIVLYTRKCPKPEQMPRAMWNGA
jgi:hypothetical protein